MLQALRALLVLLVLRVRQAREQAFQAPEPQPGRVPERVPQPEPVSSLLLSGSQPLQMKTS